jgi:hypothetical protein
MSEIPIYYDLVKIELGTEYVIKDSFSRGLHRFGDLIEKKLREGETLLGRETFEGTLTRTVGTYTTSSSVYTATAPSSYSALDFKRIVSILIYKDRNAFKDSVIFLGKNPIPHLVSPLRLESEGTIMWVYKVYFL